MMSTFIIAALILLAIVFLLYVRLITLRNRALEALSGIDVQLSLRADTIPNILKIARRFLEHEQKLLKEITELRSSLGKGYDPKSREEVCRHFETAAHLESRMGQLMVTLENYPELKSDQVMLQTQRTYNEVETQISAARRFYNSSVGDLNTQVQIFPISLIAAIAGVGQMPFYEAPVSAQTPIDADNYLR